MYGIENKWMKFYSFAIEFLFLLRYTLARS